MNRKQDLIIIGGGIMGLMTAYYASLLGKRVTILEKLTIGNKKAGSFSYTRSIRNDYLDPLYAHLSSQARRLWEEIEKTSAEKFIINCGVLNIANKKINKDLDNTYAKKSFNTISSLGFNAKYFSKPELNKEYPQFTADLGCLDVKARLLYVPLITKTILRMLRKNGVVIIEKVFIKEIREKQKEVSLLTNKKIYRAKRLAITAGIWTNEVLQLIKNNSTMLPITPDRPNQCKYFIIPKEQEKMFMREQLPVFAYLDVGIYGHPYLPGKTKGVKIGYYNPPDFRHKQSKIKSIEDFIRYCIPSLKNAKMEDVTDADQCYYDLVSDDDFIIGKLPSFKNIFIGAGWRGTGYKFAPVVGKILNDLSMNNETAYDIERFDPGRFTKGSKIDKM